jgi:hypothetical protein
MLMKILMDGVMDALAAALDDEFTPECREAWDKLLKQIVEWMLNGWREKQSEAPPPKSPKPVRRVMSERDILDVP